MAKRKLIILDRDGTVNKIVVHEELGTIDSPMNENEVELIEKVIEGLKILQSKGFEFAIATNQPAAAKGKTSLKNLEAVQSKINSLLKKSGIDILDTQTCFHKKEDNCDCRKPKTKMLLNILRKENFDLENSWMVGDSVTDVESGKNAGLKTAFLGPRKCDACKILEEKDLTPDIWCLNLFEFSQLIK